MKTWQQSHIEHCIKFSKVWNKKAGWGIWHSCFNYDYECKCDYFILSDVQS
jgi:hypothetical protein